MSQQLDRGRQLWEAWAVVGLGEGRFALIMKSHHCMTDGVVAADLATVLLSPTPAPRRRASRGGGATGWERGIPAPEYGRSVDVRWTIVPMG